LRFQLFNSRSDFFDVADEIVPFSVGHNASLDARTIGRVRVFPWLWISAARLKPCPFKAFAVSFFQFQNAIAPQCNPKGRQTVRVRGTICATVRPGRCSSLCKGASHPAFAQPRRMRT
jgi:hypothetical protein